MADFAPRKSKTSPGKSKPPSAPIDIPHHRKFVSAQPLKDENQFDRFMSQNRKMSLHPDNEKEIIAEMRRNKDKVRGSPDEE